jgi:site-specific DNA-methyltransferase (adenine-specific)
MSTPVNIILNGDCAEVLQTLDDASVDAVVTDPPYGLGTSDPTGDDINAYIQGANLDTGGDFMGKDWEIPPVRVWLECKRVLKPGGVIMAFAGTRTWDIMWAGLDAAGLLEHVGLKEKFGMSMLQWIHGQGFPKSLDIAKAIDKAQKIEKAGAEPVSEEAKKWKGWGTALKPSWEPVLVFYKDGAEPRPFHQEIDAPFFYCAKVSKSEATLDGEVENNHPTRKPLALMKWLAGLAAPKDSLILDPYCGSGTTCVAATEVGQRFVGIERDPAFHEIATKRVGIVHNRNEVARGQQDIFAMMDLLPQD